MPLDTDTPQAPQACTLALEDTPRPEEVAQVRAGLDAYNRQFAPDNEHQTLTLLLRTAQGTVVGGLLGDFYWGWLYVSILWLDENMRRQGWGTRLLQQAEQEARRRGCQHAHLDTMSFQALPFYERHGYTVFGVLEGQPTGHRRYYLRKDLVAKPAPG